MIDMLQSGWLTAVSDSGTVVGASSGGAPDYSALNSGSFTLLLGFTSAGGRV